MSLFLEGDKGKVWVDIGGLGIITVVRLTAELLACVAIINDGSFFRGRGGDCLLKLLF